MNNNFINPYSYGSNLQMPMNSMNVPQMLPKTDLITVNGENGANAYMMAPNSRAALFDTTAAILYVKSTDGAGYATVEAFDLTPHKSVQIADHLSELETRIAKLEEVMNNVNKSSIKSKQSAE